jgi:hypothetical protein
MSVGKIELGVMHRAGYDRTLQDSLREITSEVRAEVIGAKNPAPCAGEYYLATPSVYLFQATFLKVMNFSHFYKPRHRSSRYDPCISVAPYSDF